MQLSGFSPEGPHCLSAVSGTVDQKRSLDGEGPVLSLVSMCSSRRGASWLCAKIPGNLRAFKLNWPPCRSPLGGYKASASENGHSEVPVQGWVCGIGCAWGRSSLGL